MEEKITLTARFTKVDHKNAVKFANHSRQATRQDIEDRNDMIDPDRFSENITLIDELAGRSIVDFVNLTYSQDVADFNKGRKPSKQIKDYARERFLNNKKTQEPFGEFVFALGSSAELTRDGLPHYGESFENLDLDGNERECRKKALLAFGERLHEILPNFAISYAVIHMDETNPHMHVGVIGRTEQSAKTLSGKTRLSHSPGWSEAFTRTAQGHGFEVPTNKKGKPIATESFRQVVDEFAKNELLMDYQKARGVKVEREKPRTKRKSLTMQEYKKLTKPVNELAQNMAETAAKMADILNRLNAMSERMDEDEREELEELAAMVEDVVASQQDLDQQRRDIDEVFILNDEDIAELLDGIDIEL